MGSFYTQILEVNLFAFAYRLFHGDFSPICRTLRRLERNLHETVCRQMLNVCHPMIGAKSEMHPPPPHPPPHKINLNFAAFLGQ